MEPFVRLTAAAVPLDVVNVDTDQIIPARFLGRPREDGLGDVLFHDLRFAEDGTPRDFVLNHPEYEGARILVAERNFGCGSSRENAVHALYDAGFRAVIAPSFGDIFFGNCFKNGMLPIQLPTETVAAMRTRLRASPGSEIRVDLEAQEVTAPDGRRHRFEIDPFRKELLLRGIDEIQLTLGHEADIAAFERRHAGVISWI